MQIRNLPNVAPQALYPDAYVWLVLVSSMDIMMTWIVLTLGGFEMNALANGIIHRHGLPGMVIYKFAIIVFVIGLCEYIGRRNPSAGRLLARSAIVLTWIPVTLAMIQVLHRVYA